MIETRTDVALEFLNKWSPSGPWILTAISPSTGKIETRAFFADGQEMMKSWIDERNGKLNLYFTINRVRDPVDRKPSKTDISEIIAFQVDADPRVGEDLTQEKARILKAFQEFKPHPSVIVDSGSGCQAFWLLKEAIKLDGTEAMALEYEAYSVQLELLLGGDRTSNSDRIFRMPGTINLPNEVKKKKGRVPCLASIIEWNDYKYALSDFTKAQTKIQSKKLERETLADGGEKVNITGSITPCYIDMLEAQNIRLTENVKTLITQGDVGNKYNSRSEALFAVVCALIRAGADDQTVAGVIMNRDNAISASVLDKPRPERYAAKQIQDAKEFAIDPLLRKLNSKHAVISDVGGKCRIISEVFEYALHRTRISTQTFTDFINRYLNIKVQIAVDKNNNPVQKPAGKWWVEHPMRRQYDTIVFAPGRDVPEAYNLWQGFSCEAIPGDCSLFIEHVKENICSGNEEHFRYIFSWMARCVQQPDCPGEVAVILRGEMGTGKGAFCKHFGALFGRHFLQVSDPKHLVGSFNSHLRDCVLLFGDEAFWAGDKKHESVLKSLVTESTIAIEAKGVDVVSCPNYTHIILASNSSWVVPAGSNERRFFVLDVGKERMQNKKYFNALQEQMNKGGREALLHMLLTWDISNFEVREVPQTLALQDQKVLSQSSEEQWWFEKIEEGRILKDHDCWECEIMKTALQDDYIGFMQRTGIMRKASSTVLGKFLGRMCPGGVPRSYQRMAQIKLLGDHGEPVTLNRRMYFYMFPTLEECRKHWDNHHGGPFKWPPPLEKGNQMEMKPAESVFE
jgi:hypothetical protein